MYSQKQREAILAEFAASGLSLHAFARQSDVSRGTLQGWLRRDRTSDATTRRAAVFARVKVAPGIAPPVALEVVVGRARVVVSPGFAAADLRAVLEALGAFS